MKRIHVQHEIPQNHILNTNLVRKDGLRIFLDGDAQLDRIRLHETDAVKVILAVAVRRAQQIACSYALKHAPKLYGQVSRITGKYRKQLTCTQRRR